MLYHITILIIFLVLACTVIILFKKAFSFRQQTEKLQKKESGFAKELFAEAYLKSDGSIQTDDDIDNNTFTLGEERNMKNNDKKMDIKELRAFIIGIIYDMSEKKLRQLLKYLEEEGEQRKYDRKDFLRIIDYTVKDRYYRDFIQDISEGGLFIETTNEFSVGQKILMTFASPDYQKPFKINGEVIHTHTDGIGVKFNIESQVQQLVLRSFVGMIQT